MSDDIDKLKKALKIMRDKLSNLADGDVDCTCAWYGGICNCARKEAQAALNAADEALK